MTMMMMVMLMLMLDGDEDDDDDDDDDLDVVGMLVVVVVPHPIRTLCGRWKPGCHPLPAECSQWTCSHQLGPFRHGWLIWRCPCLASQSVLLRDR